MKEGPLFKKITLILFKLATLFRQDCILKGSLLRFLLKRQCHKMDTFLVGITTLISTFCVCADSIQGLSKAFHYPIQI
jgi:hypothetical protein